MNIHTVVFVAVIIAVLIPPHEALCEDTGFLNKTKCHLAAAGEKIKDVAVSAYDELSDGYDTLKSKITGNPKRTETFDVRSAATVVEVTSTTQQQDEEGTILFPSSSEQISIDDRAIFQVPTVEANCPPGTRSDSKGRCRVYS